MTTQKTTYVYKSSAATGHPKVVIFVESPSQAEFADEQNEKANATIAAKSRMALRRLAVRKTSSVETQNMGPTTPNPFLHPPTPTSATEPVNYFKPFAAGLAHGRPPHAAYSGMQQVLQHRAASETTLVTNSDTGKSRTGGSEKAKERTVSELAEAYFRRMEAQAERRELFGRE